MIYSSGKGLRNIKYLMSQMAMLTKMCNSNSYIYGSVTATIRLDGPDNKYNDKIHL